MHPCWIRARTALATASLFIISSTALAQSSYADAAGPGATESVVQWLQGTLLGTVATVAAVIAVAAVGLMMLTGRLDVRRAVRVLLGCFIIFGASTISTGIAAALSSSPTDPEQDLAEPPALNPPPVTVPVNSVPAVTDPYAGAAVPPR